MPRTLTILTLMILVIALSTATAAGLDRLRENPASPIASSGGEPGDRVGGDTVTDAVMIATLPFYDSGSTCGFNDDYDAACTDPSTAPDVVYAYQAVSDVVVDVDLCGSAYDTKVFVLNEAHESIACSDDTFWEAGHPCGQWNARLEFLALEAGVVYYIVVDGWGSGCGPYELAVVEHEPCEIACPPGAVLEDEPPMQGEYDQFNAGCFSDWSNPLPYIVPVPDQGENTAICGFNGYYDIPDGMGYDHDWWQVVIGDAGTVEVTLWAQRSTWLVHFALPDGDCNQAAILEEVTCRPCESATLTIYGEPGTTGYFWVHTHYNVYPNGAYPYTVLVDGGTVATVGRSWSAVKDQYR
jgi:hypothetical protein